MAFLDAAGICLILERRDPPINPVVDDHGGLTVRAPISRSRRHGVGF
jgi:hypothetical protein